MSTRTSIACVLLVACSSSTSAHPPTTAPPTSQAPSPWRGAPICRAQLAPDDVAQFETRAQDGQSTCEERERLAAHYFDLQLETYDRWLPQLDEHLVWLANQCPDSNQTCLLSLMVPSVALVSAWEAQAKAQPTNAIVRDNADAVAWQAKRDSDVRGEPRLLENLSERAADAFDTGNLRSAEAYSIEMLLRVPLTPKSSNKGELIRHAHALLGRIALRTGDTTGAKRQLLVAGKTEGSSPLITVTPMWGLAADLLDVGERDTVIEYLELSKAEWPHAASMIDEWQREIRDGAPSTMPWHH
jgi:hypothetical protein